MATLSLSRTQQTWLVMAIIASSWQVWAQLSWWVMGISFGAILWRSLGGLYGKGAPSRWVLFGLLLISVVLILVNYRPPIGLEPMSSLLVIALSLKFLETRKISDTVTILYLCHFVAATSLLFEQGIGDFFFAFVAVLVALAAQMQSQKSPLQGFRFTRPTSALLRPVLSLIGLAMPIALLLFLIVPRFPSFWAIPMPQSGKTGFSDRLVLGQIGALARSDDLAFRIDFEGEIPPPNQRYWRGVVLTHFDGTQWSTEDNSFSGVLRQGSLWSQNSRPDWVDGIQFIGKEYRYDVFLEPHDQLYLFGLAGSEPVQAGLGVTRDLLVKSREPVIQRIRYSLSSRPESRYEVDRLTAADERLFLRYPEQGNPQTVALAAEWRRQNWQAEQILAEISNRFRQSFTYTLNPPVYGDQAIDQFLFGQQAGFCEHFASAAALLLRAAGIPSRVVLGYQGGELNPESDYLVVRQLDAHAWVEYWQSGYGWQKYDPTQAVAPERIERGIEQIALADNLPLSDSTFALINFRQSKVFNWVRWQLDGLNYYWSRWVLAYDQRQRTAIVNWFKAVKLDWMTLLYVIFTGLLLGALRWGLRRRWTLGSSVPAYLVAFREFRAKLVKRGVTVPVSATPLEIFALAESVSPTQRSEITALKQTFIAVVYQERERDESLCRALKAFRFV